MTPELRREILRLVEENRDRALWSLAPNFVPDTSESARRILETIAARADRATFVRARQLIRQLD